MAPHRNAHARPFSPRPDLLTPLAAALALCWPLAHAAPPKATVPVPAATWRVSGSGAAAPVNRPNAQGGTSQTIQQTSARAIYQWDSFDIGADSSVTFDMAVQGASALNRVTGSSSPSLIFGQLKATRQGQIYLINPNGILFGRGAQVDTGSLIASTLNLSDSEFNSGFGQSLATLETAHFAYDGDPAHFIDSENFVRVDAGARITTSSGGQVMLFAKRVDNAGSITAPDGQVILGAGGSVKLKLPSQESALYAAEENANLQVLRGFLVEMGHGPGGEGGTASNLASGQISTPRGNTTLVGMAVNQQGRISATTSVSANGSILLKAQGGATYDANEVTYRSREGGALTLGADSVTTITPDGETASQTANGSSTFVQSFAELSGRSVVMASGAQLVAPAATVVVRAESTPSYQARSVAETHAGDSASRIVIGEHAVIDLSGTTDTQRSVADLFVTTELLGSNDLKDAPVQKDGLLYRAKVTVDTRQDSLILGDLDSYRNTVAKTASEWMSVGGQLQLQAEGAVLTASSSRIRLNGGLVSYTAADVAATRLVAQDGRVYDLANAPVDLVYSNAYNLQKSAAIRYDRWGQQTLFGRQTRQHEDGYVQGRDAGSLSIIAPTVQLTGALEAQATEGSRQQAGLDTLARAGSLTIGAQQQGGESVLSTANQEALAFSAVLQNFRIGSTGPVLGADVASQPLTATLDAESGIASARLQAAGFADISVIADGAVQLDAVSATPLALADQGSLTLGSITGNVTLAQSVRSAGGSVKLVSKSRSLLGEVEKVQGSVQVADGVSVDLSGRWVNQWLDATPRSTAATGGGSFSAEGLGVRLGQGSVVDVSGGGSVSVAGSVSAANAGSITVSDQTAYPQAAAATAPTLDLQGELRGYSAASSNGVSSGGGSLTLKTTRVQIGAGSAADANTLVLDPLRFSEGGFSSVAVDGRLSLDVTAGTQLAPERSTWMATPDSRLLANGQAAAHAFVPGRAAGLLAGAVNLSLSSAGDSKADALGVDNGRLLVAEGASLRPGDSGQVSLSASHLVDLEGQVVAHGGQVQLAITPGANAQSAPAVWVGAPARIDVSGSTRYTPDRSDGLVTGTVLAGGQITLRADSASGGAPGSVIVQSGARLDASGSAAELDVVTRSDTGVQQTRQQVGSTGGRITVSASGSSLLEGELALAGGTAQQAGGSLQLTQTPGMQGGLDASGVLDARHVLLSQASSQLSQGVSVQDRGALLGAIAGQAVLNADQLNASGLADLQITTPGDLHLVGDVQLSVGRRLQVEAQALRGDEGRQSQLRAASVLLSGPEALGQYQGYSVSQREAAQTGSAQLAVQASAGMALSGELATAGFASVDLRADGGLQLRDGRLDSAADLTLQAPVVSTATGTTYAIDASGHRVRLTGGDAQAATPMSAGGRVSIQAEQIEQGGVLRAPNGQIALMATGAVNLLDGSVTSVAAAAGQTLYGSYGSTSDEWRGLDGNSANTTGSLVSAAPTKSVSLSGPSVSVDAQATVDARGQGSLLATEFVAGSGGSQNILAGGDGAYALLPGAASLAASAYRLSSTEAAMGRQIVIARTLRLGDGSVLPAGTYTLLPAAYAALDGAFLVRPASGTAALAEGSSLARTDGSLTVGARLSDAGTGFSDALTSNWQVLSHGIAARYSEVRRHDLSDVLSARAEQQGSALGLQASDGGAVAIQAAQLRLQGTLQVSGDASQHGRGGVLGIVASQIQVDADAPVQDSSDGVLHIGVDSLNQVSGGTVILGGVRQVDGSGVATVQTVADQVVFAQGAATPVTASDLLATARQRLSLGDGTRFIPQADTASADTLVLQGQGAALRVSSRDGASLSRTAAQADSATVQVGESVQLGQGQGGVALDSTGTVALTASARLAAPTLSLAAGQMTLGDGDTAGDRLHLDQAALNRLAGTDQLTLRAYGEVQVRTGTVLGQAGQGSITLDTPVLRLTGATGQALVQAEDITLRNSTGQVGQASGNAAGTLAVQASQQLALGDGVVALGGAGTVALQAGEAVQVRGSGSLRTTQDLRIDTPLLANALAASSYALSAGGQLTVTGQPAAASPAAALGGSLALYGQGIDIDTRIALPSGTLSLQAGGDVQLGARATLDAAGRQVAVGSHTVATAGGTVSLLSENGDITLDAGSVIDVSGAANQGAGGTLGLSAAHGRLNALGSLRGRAASADLGSTLVADAAGLNLHQLLRAADDQSFLAEVDVRQRQGDLVVAATDTVRARTITLDADRGALQVLGTLDARGEDGGRVRLSASGDVGVLSGGQVLAQATGQDGQGGHVSLSTLGGRVHLDAGSVVRVAAGTAGDASLSGGKLTLRAAQQGNDVAIDPIAGTVDGATRIDVQAVKVYEHVDRIVSGPVNEGGVLGSDTIAEDAAQFIGLMGEHANAVAQRLGSGAGSAVLDALRVHAEAEVRADGKLMVQTDSAWALPADLARTEALGGNAAHVGDTSLTLRAKGSLISKWGIASGLDVDTGAATSAHGGDLTLIAGADMTAANTRRTRSVARDTTVGELRIEARDPSLLSFTGSSTGDVTLAAAGDLSIERKNTVVLSTGAPRSEAATAVYGQSLWFYGDQALQRDGGDVTLRAGGSVLGDDYDQFSAGESGVTYLLSGGQLGQFDSGQLIWGGSTNQAYTFSYLGSYGGGQIRVDAGANISNLVAVAPSSGYHLNAEDGSTVDVRYAGGQVQVRAGRNIVSGAYESGGRLMRLSAGQDVQRSVNGAVDDTRSTRLYYENGAVQVDARRHVAIGELTDAYLEASGGAIALPHAQASAQVTATAGSLRLGGAIAAGDPSNDSTLPDDTLLAAPSGDVALVATTIEQRPQSDGQLSLLAGGNLSIGSNLLVYATHAGSGAPEWLGDDPRSVLASEVFNDQGVRLDQSSRSPVTLVARDGDVSIDAAVQSARSVRLEAGRDVLVRERLLTQLQPDAATGAESEQVLLQAGRDIVFSRGAGLMRVGGTGEVLLLAGRNIDLGSANAYNSSGVMAVGNQDNALLGQGSAQVTLVASLSADGQDYRRAVGQGFEAIGSSALAGRAADVFAFLSDTTIGTLGSGAAQGFAALDRSGQLARVRQLMGDSAYQAALARYVRQVDDSRVGLADAQAVAAFDRLSEAQQDAAAGQLLAQLAGGLPTSRRSALIGQIAQQDTPRLAAGLQAWMALRTGQQLGLAEAIAAFEALPLERQVGWLNQVLVEEVRSAGRSAASSSGYEQQAAYLRGYLAIDTVFAGERVDGHIALPSTQVKTVQDAHRTLVAAQGGQAELALSGITLMAPGGGVNAGETGSTAQASNNLGIVTVAGGGISAIARDDFLVNQSRVFTLGSGDMLIWSSQGDIDAGRGAKTVTAVPAPVLRLDAATGRLYLDTSGAYAGSGIAVGGASSNLDLYAPAGAIDAGEAGIKAAGNVFLGATAVRGADNIQVGGQAAGVSISTAPLTLPAMSPTSVGDAARAGNADDEEERRKRRNRRRQLLLDFLGFGRG